MSSKIFLSGSSEMIPLFTQLYKELLNYDVEPIWYLKKFNLEVPDAIEACFMNVEEADRLILAIGKNYGTIYEKTGSSITEEEYLCALNLNLPIIIFVDSLVYNELKDYEELKNQISRNELKQKVDEDFSADLKVYEFLIKIKNIGKIPWTKPFLDLNLILSELKNKWNLIKLDNYDSILRVDLKEPKYFRMLAESGQRGSIFHIDIQENMVIRIGSIVNKLKTILTNDNIRSSWVLISGRSGLSKTTTAKIFAYDLKALNFSVRFENYLEGIKNFIERVKINPNKWLIIIDDLHRDEYGAVYEKLDALAPLLQKKNIKILSTSRLTLTQMKGLYGRKGDRTAEVLSKFTEINVDLTEYDNDFKTAKEDLILKILKEKDIFNSNQIKGMLQQLMSDYSLDFVTLGFALLPIINNKTTTIDKNFIYNGLKTFLLEEFEAILSKTSVDPQICLGVFIGTCYESLIDETVSVEDFITVQDSMEKRKNVLRTLNQFFYRGIFLKSVKTMESERKILAFSLTHAKIAENYIIALKMGFEIDDQIFRWEEVCSLIRFKASILGELELNEIFSNFRNLISIDISGCDVKNIPESLGRLKLLRELYLENCHLEHLPESIGELKQLKTLNLRYNSLKSLPNSIENLDSLKRLYLTRNKLVKPPTFMKSLENLQELYLNHNNLSNFSNILEFPFNLNILDLSNCQLTEVPESIISLKSLKELNLNYNKIQKLPNSVGNLIGLEKLHLNGNKLRILPESLGNLTHLKKIFAINNKLEEIPDSICKISSLKHIKLDLNNLTELPESLGDLKSLRKLYLRGNELSTLPESIGNCEKLKKIVLDNNRLIKLPESIGQLKFLKKLMLYSNLIEFIPKSIENLINLEQLDMRLNKFNELPEYLGSLYNIKELYLSYNNLSTLPDSLQNLKSIQVLDLSTNPILSIPDIIWNLKSLKILSLRATGLETLSEKVGKLKLLEIISLESNSLKSLPESIGKLKGLKSIRLYRNKLTSLPESIGELESLEKLLIYENRLTYIPKSIGKLKWLKVLSLQHNQIEQLPEIIGNLRSLTNLDLNHNQLKFLPESIGNLKNLRELSLNYNSLEVLPESIKNNDSIEKLFLKNNKLKELPLTIAMLNTLKFLDLSDNFFDFENNFQLTKTIGMLKEKNVTIIK